MYANVDESLSILGAGELVGVNTVSSRNLSSKPKLETLSYTEILKSIHNETAVKPVDEKEDIVIDSVKVVERYNELRAALQKLQPEITEKEKSIQNAESRLAKVDESLSDLSKLVNEMPNITPIARNKFLDSIDKFLQSTKNSLHEILSGEQAALALLQSQSSTLVSKISKISTMLSVGLKELLDPDEKERLATGKQCSICTVNSFDQVLDCGHVLCSECLPKIGTKCFMCRKAFKKPIKLFLPSGEMSQIIPPVPHVPVAPWGEV